VRLPYLFLFACSFLFTSCLSISRSFSGRTGLWNGCVSGQLGVRVNGYRGEWGR
jgi:hypothetical protein